MGRLGRTGTWLLFVLSNAIVFVGLVWFGWSPGAVVLGFSAQIVAAGLFGMWRFLRAPRWAQAETHGAARLALILIAPPVVFTGVVAYQMLHGEGVQDGAFWLQAASILAILLFPMVLQAVQEVSTREHVRFERRDHIALWGRVALFWLVVWISGRLFGYVQSLLRDPHATAIMCLAFNVIVDGLTLMGRPERAVWSPEFFEPWKELRPEEVQRRIRKQRKETDPETRS